MTQRLDTPLPEVRGEGTVTWTEADILRRLEVLRACPEAPGAEDEMDFLEELLDGR